MSNLHTPPPPRRSKPFSTVLYAGLATSALALFGVFLLAKYTDEYIMGLYVNYVLPAGAMLVGVVAASGYGVVSWLTGVKITRSLLAVVLALQLCTYFLAQYIEFESLHLAHADGTPVGFIEHFDAAARGFAWKDRDGKPGEALGAWGYLFRGLEILGFGFGGLLVPILLSKAPYCQQCQMYMRRRKLALVPASVPLRKIKKTDAAALAAYEHSQQEAATQGRARLDQLCHLATGADSAGFCDAIKELVPGKKQAAKLPSRLSVDLVCCRYCWSGYLHLCAITGKGEKVQSAELGTLSVTPDFARSVHGGR